MSAIVEVKEMLREPIGEGRTTAIIASGSTRSTIARNTKHEVFV